MQPGPKSCIVEDGVKDLARSTDARASSSLWGWEVRLQQRPFGVGEVCGVSVARHVSDRDATPSSAAHPTKACLAVIWKVDVLGSWVTAFRRSSLFTHHPVVATPQLSALVRVVLLPCPFARGGHSLSTPRLSLTRCSRSPRRRCPRNRPQGSRL